jgi:hypothetical protein
MTFFARKQRVGEAVVGGRPAFVPISRADEGR